MSADAYLTTPEVAEAIGVSKATILRWAAQDVLPRPVIVHGGRRGRVARWPLHTPAQGRWVLTQLEAHLTWAEIRAALEAGRFDPSVSGEGNS
ncbi:MAG: hypothetical protein H0T76_21500 [Nannocystis sp.]|nr:helix-turn-helix domain-containing protein [Nannocystis sp.]MBA3549068.1 hypothetical protein [Nannocystis sp.]